MALICGLWRHGRAAEGLANLFEALPAQSWAEDRAWTNGTVAMGCRNRAVKDPSGRPPLLDPESGLVVTASARLNGRGELCDALGIRAPDKGRITDSELILRAWRCWGRTCPQHLLGDYAFSVWDPRRKTLFCTRDHIGAKPFYYAQLPDGFVFASEIGAVLAAPGVDLQLDESAVADWLSPRKHFHYGERTFYRAVRRLPPGHSLTLDRNGMRVERWWRPEEAPAVAPASDGECAEAFLALYERAVRDCLRTTLPIGAHLSGGLDSSAVAVLAARELRRQGRAAPRLFSWHPPRPEAPRNRQQQQYEYAPIEAVCRQTGLAPVWCPPCAGDAVAFLRRDVTLGQVTGTLMQEAVVQRRAAQLGVGVILSGWGGDEAASFNGRGYYEQLLLRGRFGRLWRDTRQRTDHPLAYILSDVALRLLLPRAWRMVKDVRRGVRRGVWKASPSAPVMRYTSVRGAQIALLLHGHIGERAEGWAEAGARAGVEYRYPLLDRRLLSFALGLPPHMYRRGPWSRWIMRHALRGVLPCEVLRRRTKEEPVREQARRRVQLEAIPEIRRLLASHSAPLGRSRYVDLPRVMKSLDRTESEGESRSGLGSALRFLDF